MLSVFKILLYATTSYVWSCGQLITLEPMDEWTQRTLGHDHILRDIDRGGIYKPIGGRRLNMVFVYLSLSGPKSDRLSKGLLPMGK